jgi:hypothetical protein
MAIQIKKAKPIIKNVTSTNNILFITPFRGHDDGRQNMTSASHPAAAIWPNPVRIFATVSFLPLLKNPFISVSSIVVPLGVVNPFVYPGGKQRGLIPEFGRRLLNSAVPASSPVVYGEREKNLRIVIVGSEMTGVAGSGGLGDIIRVLPEELNRAGHKAIAVVPFYKQHISSEMAARRRLIVEELPVLMNRPGSLWQERASLWRLDLGALEVYLIENDTYFNRTGERGALYGPREDEAFADNDERFIFFDKAVLEALRVLAFQPDVIHAHDWQTGLIPVYSKEFYKEEPLLKDAATVYTIHNLRFEGAFPAGTFAKTGLPGRYFDMEGIEFYGRWSFAKAGLYYADKISTVSRSYVLETLVKEMGHGFHGLLRKRYQEGDYAGIPNGKPAFMSPSVIAIMILPISMS